jgi:hypothetical protein
MTQKYEVLVQLVDGVADLRTIQADDIITDGGVVSLVVYGNGKRRTVAAFGRYHLISITPSGDDGANPSPTNRETMR